MVSEMFGEACPASAPFFGYMGAAAALIFASTCPVLHFPHACRRLGVAFSCVFVPHSSKSMCSIGESTRARRCPPLQGHTAGILDGACSGATQADVDASRRRRDWHGVRTCAF
jgi:hypothetical protein